MVDTLQSLGDLAVTQSTAPRLSGKAAVSGNVDKASKDFEGMFVTQMLQPMFEGIGTNSMFGGGHGEEVMKTFMLQEYGKIAAQSGQLGIASSVKAEMLKAQAAAQTTRMAQGGSYASIQ